MPARIAPAPPACLQTPGGGAVQEMIIASLRYWVTEVHVDGFRFDLGSIMTRAHSLWQPPSPAAPGDAPASAQGSNSASATWPHVSGAQQPGEHTPSAPGWDAPTACRGASRRM